MPEKLRSIEEIADDLGIPVETIYFALEELRGQEVAKQTGYLTTQEVMELFVEYADIRDVHNRNKLD